MVWELDKGLENWPEYKDVHIARLARAALRPWSGDLSHAYVNAHVEAGRMLPYQYGHWNAIAYPLALVGLVGIVYHLVAWLL